MTEAEMKEMAKWADEKVRQEGNRGKLVELLMDMPFGRATEEEETAHIGDVAEYLIANGVTVQEWIPVTERLPEDDTRVLVYIRDGYGGNEMVDTDRCHNGRWVRWNKYITHWTPISISTPPKGE